MDNQDSFQYTYSAAQQQEIEHIRKKYLPKEEDKMEKLRSLHYSATRKAKAASIAMGLIGTLILGIGMSIILTELGFFLGDYSMVTGIVVGFIGMVMIALAYPVYNHVLKTERKRIAPEILRLSDELLK